MNSGAYVGRCERCGNDHRVLLYVSTGDEVNDDAYYCKQCLGLRTPIISRNTKVILILLFVMIVLTIAWVVTY